MVLRNLGPGLGLALLLTGVAAAEPRVLVTSQTSSPAAHPIAVTGSNGPVLRLGGGARANWTGGGSLLFNSSPTHGRNEWVAEAKDQWVSDPATLSAYMLYLDDPDHRYEVRTFTSASSAVSANPGARATVPPGWVLTGGGCSVDWRSAQGPGNLLTGSYPDVKAGGTADTWVCSAKSHGGDSPADMVAVAIGIRLSPTAAGYGTPPRMCVSQVTSAPGAYPLARAGNCAADQGGQITGGGARAQVPAPGPDRGQLLTATAPVMTRGAVSGWEARSKEHSTPSPGTVTAYAISLVF